MLEILSQNPILFLMLLLILILSLSFHEFAHAYVADKLGDPTARYMGRLTVNPLVHMDPIGLIMIILVGFGWAKPVPFNQTNLSDPKRDAALIAFAGPLSNVLIALVSAIIAAVVPLNSFFQIFLYLISFFNINLALFNLLPIHPLDGFKVVTGLLPWELAYKWEQLQSYGFVILILVIYSGISSKVIMPIASIIMNFLF